MYEPGVELRQLRVWMDIPEELDTAIKQGMEKINSECLTQNAEVVLVVFQEIILKHVLSMHNMRDQSFSLEMCEESGCQLHVYSL